MRPRDLDPHRLEFGDDAGIGLAVGDQDVDVLHAAKRTRCSRPSLLLSASTITRWAARAMARLVAASASSGVLKPCTGLMPLVPRKATSTRRSCSARMVASPTAVCVMPRTRPPSTCRVTPGLADSRAAIGTELVAT